MTFSRILLFLLLIFGFAAPAQKFKVALDAGHGGKDVGATYHGFQEKKISLAVVKKVGKILEKTPGFEVIYTRKSDVFVELVERANIANRVAANIFVSIHCNANKNQAAEGTETYVMGMTKVKSNLEAAKRENQVVTMEKDYQKKYDGFDPHHPESMIGVELMQEQFLDNSITLASKLQNLFVNRLKKKGRGVKQAPYMVLHKAYMPRVLIEMGFISNKKDGAFLNSEAGQDKMAKAIADAIIAYKKEYYGSGQKEAETTEVKPAKDKTATSSSGVKFKVQISASSRNLPLKAQNFKGLKNVTMAKAGKLYKYYYGEASVMASAEKLLATAKAKGYGSAFIVAFKNGKQVGLDEAGK